MLTCDSKIERMRIYKRDLIFEVTQNAQEFNTRYVASSIIVWLAGDSSVVVVVIV